MYTGSLKLVLLQVLPSYQPSELLGSNGLNHRVCNAVWIGALLHVAARSTNLAQASAVGKVDSTILKTTRCVTVDRVASAFIHSAAAPLASHGTVLPNQLERPLSPPYKSQITRSPIITAGSPIPPPFPLPIPRRRRPPLFVPLPHGPHLATFLDFLSPARGFRLWKCRTGPRLVR
jgi:hypothetical protein